MISDESDTFLLILFSGDENRRTLLDLGAVDSLLRLIQHEDRVVHRNACMALGSMAGHSMYL